MYLDWMVSTSSDWVITIRKYPPYSVIIQFSPLMYGLTGTELYYYIIANYTSSGNPLISPSYTYIRAKPFKC